MATAGVSFLLRFFVLPLRSRCGGGYDFLEFVSDDVFF